MGKSALLSIEGTVNADTVLGVERFARREHNTQLTHRVYV
jgi:hypothetical protein